MHDGTPRGEPSRRAPPANRRSADFWGRPTEPDEARRRVAPAGGATHLFFAAYLPQASWAEEVGPNRALLVNAVEGLESVGAPLQHVTLVTGVKYYSDHLGPRWLPAHGRVRSLSARGFRLPRCRGEERSAELKVENNFRVLIKPPRGPCSEKRAGGESRNRSTARLRGYGITTRSSTRSRRALATPQRVSHPINRSVGS
jgi:hypothetical protein